MDLQLVHAVYSTIYMYSVMRKDQPVVWGAYEYY